MKVLLLLFLLAWGCTSKTETLREKLTSIRNQSAANQNSGAYWACQCFTSTSSGGPDGGVSIKEATSLSDAEEKAVKECGSSLKIARCHKYISGPTH